MISLALLSALATGIIAYINTTNSMKLAAEDKLIALLESRKSSLQQYFTSIENKVQFHSQSPLVINALTDFSNAWDKLPADKLGYLQSQYIDLNPYNTGQKDSLLHSQDPSAYSTYHRQYHPTFKNMIESRDYYDFFLFDANGNLIYTVKKESDYATNIISGAWQDTQLAQVFNQINEQPLPHKLVYADFKSYGPSNNEPASFIATAVFNKDHKYIGVVAYQMPIEPLDSIMHVTAGMGESGETYLVGKDLLMRSNSRFLTQRSILQKRVDTSSVAQALAGKNGVATIADYRDVQVLSAYTPIDFLGTRWAMLVEIDHQEVMEPVYTLSNFLLISGSLIAIVICLLGYLLATDISRPIVAMTKIMSKLSNDELEVNISVNERKDEIGHMANAMVVFKQNAIDRANLHRELRYIVEHDPLTDLYTRKFALEQVPTLMKQALKDGTRLVLMFIDVDDFKLINDTYGHSVGDRVLTGVANNLKSCIRSNDIVARIGGDEFLILLPEISDLDDSKHVAQKIVSSVQIPLPITGDDTKLTLSIGMSVFPDDGNDVLELMRQADKAMYSVKDGGKNSFSFWNSAH